ncbi:hypothetical protein DAEQUDRAFT_726916 [Daedalea quercina L-15889]|uniref:PRA1 family protein n=1 Tax=Daedalea quercina L-15889 TaxID=1314783 RepID=A0A165QE09_9APHY|nr:hypothetical protein DAEQUDRAFT_726916 [Daedalea quercina L-15889]
MDTVSHSDVAICILVAAIITALGAFLIGIFVVALVIVALLAVFVTAHFVFLGRSRQDIFNPNAAHQGLHEPSLFLRHEALGKTLLRRVCPFSVVDIRSKDELCVISPPSSRACEGSPISARPKAAILRRDGGGSPDWDL